jgi:hypothetical protein
MANRSDNFNRANGAIGSPSDGGSAWSVLVGSASVSSNSCNVGGNAFDAAVLEASTSEVDVTMVQAVTPSVAFGRLVGMCCRMSDASNGWYLELRSGGTATTVTPTLHRRQSGTNNLEVSCTSVTVGAGDSFRINCSGDTIRVYHTPSGGSESLLGTKTSATFNQTETKHGIASVFKSQGLGDDFAIVDLAAGGSFIDNTRHILNCIQGGLL